LYGSCEDIPGGNVKIPGGYVNVFSQIHRKVEDKILYGRKVNEIQWNEGGKVRVTCQSGESFVCDQVVVTVSLGVLKNSPNLFRPELPDEKKRAIESIGFGRVAKVFAEFPEPFWAEGEEVIKIAWGKEQIVNKTDWYHHILGFDEVLNNGKVLVCWLGGSGAQMMETLSEEKVKEDLTSLIRRLTGDESLPEPINIKRTR